MNHTQPTLTHLDKLEAKSLFILREAYHHVPKLAMLWSFGKDSTVMLHLARKAFLGHPPFPLIHCDTELEMDEVYAYRDQYVRAWNLKLITAPCPSLETTDATLPPDARVAARKTGGLKHAIKNHHIKGIIAGIRKDEEATRAKERVFSPRSSHGAWDTKNQPPEFWGHYLADIPEDGTLRIHPLLDWTESDIWRYIKQESIPVVPLYFAKHYPEYNNQMMRFRSLGEKGITFPVPSTATSIDEIIEELETTQLPERTGRPMGAEDESSFERLRADGYM